MQLTRAMLTIALAASTTSALPMCKADSEDCVSPQDLNLDDLEGAAGATDEQSTHGSTQAHIESGFHSSGIEENLTTNQHAQRNIIKNSGSYGMPNMNSSDNKTGANSLLNGSDQQSEGLIQVSMTPESQFAGQGSSRSAGHNSMPSIQQSTSKYQHNNGANGQTNAGSMGHSQNQMSPNHKATGTTGFNHAKPSNKMGFAHKVRELFSVFRQGQRQGQASTEQQSEEMRSEEQNQQQQSSELAVGNRQDKDQSQTSSNENNMNDMELNSGMQQNQGMYEASSMPNHQDRNSMTQGQNVQEQTDNMTPSQNQETAHPDAQQHSAEYQEISQLSQPLYISPNRKNSRSHTEQHAEAQGYDQESQQHQDAEDNKGQREQHMDQEIQQEQQAQETMQMD
jgi:hypothetical protein